MLGTVSPHPSAPGADTDLPPWLRLELLRALRAIRYGAIELVIHEGRVVQLEWREKLRFEHGVRDQRR